MPPTLQQATANPRLPWRLLDTHGHVWVSFLWGHCSFLLGPGAHKVLFVTSKSLFPQSSVSASGSMVGLMGTSSKRAYTIPRSAAPRASAAGHGWPKPPQETLRHGSGSVSVGWACVLCPSEGWAAPETRCLVSPPPGWTMCLNHLPGPGCSVFWLCTISGVLCMSPLERRSQAATLWWVSTIQDLRKTGLAAGSLLTVWWKMPSLGLRL